MRFMKESITFTNKYIRENLLKYILICGIIFVVLGIVAFFAVRSVSVEDMSEIYQAIENAILGKEGVITADGNLSFSGVFFNNFRVCALMVIAGFIPFLFIPVLIIVVNSAVIGGLIGIVDVLTTENIAMMFVKYMLPHGIFELPAFVFGGAIGVKICFFCCRKIFRKAKEEKLTFHLKGCGGMFVIYIIPMLLIAAFIETVILGSIYL